MDWANQTGPRAGTPYRVRPAPRGRDPRGHDPHGRDSRGHPPRTATPPGVHLAGVGQGSGPAHGRPRSRATAVAGRVGAALIVFVLALLLVTGIEAVAGQPLSGGKAGRTTLGELFHPSH
jgi:hypothetical protein